MSSFGDGFNWGEVKLGITYKVVEEEESSSLVLYLLSLDPQTKQMENCAICRKQLNLTPE